MFTNYSNQNYGLRLKLRNLNSILYVCKDVFGAASGIEENPICGVNMKNKFTLSIALAVASLTLSFLPSIYASGPESDSDDRFNDTPSAVIALVGNMTNATSTDCPIIDGEGRGYDLVDRGWCHDYTGLLRHLLP